ncbi:hypothetical protein AJ85_06590 [Alkalihalobacillus alcalophilus ATCC 27647 = CGMCC 1.3604]|uniref:Uncharacterized protein n=1 Tax=Alkalihalobacillus alcalophilus ATCC 27647 = CGMCC 1.3604 TaxID=1218173 RepID=A0A094WLQ2_ALKAL|nr:hypothetical protein [Alkalihalobacillus alcalophilus]YP_009276849.1 hypothetical protein BH791_gp43 [Bacillus phage BalMu-1]AJA42421.1 hypothetical protein BalMu1_B43 [Bacillus phage BalMu-1]AJA42477.1 hypothetical protein BalMu1_A43 [Bacillus phage BalMu-1]KGA96873.1 hypothetical protein BALCAV_0213735 [Alkalihalobacillus alcalophilus ATCC 27647 = CGMCC 1.3604]MED1561163.1 hypothetical protein [Alkalihalobacillus alcalophilus]THG91152.1 hypothetical protein AJ85_06590 [Alkalihalobacillus
MSDPFSELADTIDRHVGKRSKSATLGIPSVLGTITSSGVKLDDFKHPITDPLYSQGLRSTLRNGDRVLCVLVNGGNDTVIVCAVARS